MTIKVRSKSTSLAVVGALLTSVATAFPTQAAEVPFAGAVTSACVLQAGTPGILQASGDNKVLSSKESGGVAGSVAVLATGGNFKVTTKVPTGFTSAPTGANTDTSFETFYSMTGATTSQEVSGQTETDVAFGASLMLVDLKASKSSGVFPAGDVYQAVVTVTCE